MKPLVILPTYNEAGNIEEVIRLVRGAAPGASVLVVDDGSADGTADIADKVGIEVSSVNVMRRPAKSGLGDAYRAGFRWGMDRGHDVLVEMDSDLSHDPRALPQLLGALETNDLVVGSRYVPGGAIPDWTWHRRLLSRGGNAYSSLMLGTKVKDMTSGYRAYRASLLEALDLGSVRSDGYGFQIEMTYRAARSGARITEVPIRFVDRTVGESKMSSHIVVEALGWVTLWGLQRLAGKVRRPAQTGAISR